MMSMRNMIMITSKITLITGKMIISTIWLGVMTEEVNLLFMYNTLC